MQIEYAALIPYTVAAFLLALFVCPFAVYSFSLSLSTISRFGTKRTKDSGGSTTADVLAGNCICSGQLYRVTIGDALADFYYRRLLHDFRVRLLTVLILLATTLSIASAEPKKVTVVAFGENLQRNSSYNCPFIKNESLEHDDIPSRRRNETCILVLDPQCRCPALESAWLGRFRSTANYLRR